VPGAIEKSKSINPAYPAYPAYRAGRWQAGGRQVCG